MNKPLLRVGLPRLAVFPAAVVLWEYFLSRSQNFLLPSFSHVATGLFHLIFLEPRFWEALYISNQALVLGYAASVLVGIPLGLVAARVPWMDRLLTPYFA